MWPQTHQGRTSFERFASNSSYSGHTNLAGCKKSVQELQLLYFEFQDVLPTLKVNTEL